MDPLDSWFQKFMKVPYKETIKFKLQASVEDLTSGKRCSVLVPIFKEAYSYALNEVPNYSKLIHLLERELI